MDRHGSRVFVMTAHSVAGALPVGLFITNSESEVAITKGLKHLKEVLPAEDAFYGRNELGPKLFMTDDSSAERNSLKSTWPLALLLLCIFHVLKSVWSYLWDSQNGVQKSERSELYFPQHLRLGGVLCKQLFCVLCFSVRGLVTAVEINIFSENGK